jgi:hypothetical protein
MTTTLHELAALDPLAFWFKAAELLPKDPATVADISRLASIGEGLLRITKQITIEIDAIDRHVKDGAKLSTLAGERTVLEALQRRGELARRRLRTYSATAAEANGITS